MMVPHRLKRSGKRALIGAVTRALQSPLSKAVRWRCDERPNLLRVLTYHRVDHPHAEPDLAPETLSATPAEFAEQMDYVSRQCRPVTPTQLLEAVVGVRSLPPRAVLLTFDDAYRDFASHAWPVLRRLGLPTVLFVPTAYPDRPNRAFWWDRLYQLLCRSGVHSADTPLGRMDLSNSLRCEAAYRRMLSWVQSTPHDKVLEFLDQWAAQGAAPPARGAVLGWAELSAMQREGLTLAPHTRTHPLLNRIDREAARREVYESCAELREQTGNAATLFAYPGGAVDDHTQSVLAAAGIRLAFTTRRGVNDLARCDPLLLRRINIGHGAGCKLLEIQLSMRPDWMNALCRFS